MQIPISAEQKSLIMLLLLNALGDSRHHEDYRQEFLRILRKIEGTDTSVVVIRNRAMYPEPFEDYKFPSETKPGIPEDY